MSRNAVSGEHLAIAAHLLLVSLPSKPSSSRLTSFTCRLFSGVVAHRCQNRAFDVTVHRSQRTDVGAEATGDGGADRLDVELFTLDLAGLDDVLR